jgi:hypothetical protein
LAKVLTRLQVACRFIYMRTSAPTLESITTALTTTATEKRVRIFVASIDSETETGWFVYGYRMTSAQRYAQAHYPTLYFIPKAV